MLFILTFDEHGGTYDHAHPTVGLPPDDNVGNSGFAFNRLGVRVPMLLISPYITAGTVFRAPEPSKYDFGDHGVHGLANFAHQGHLLLDLQFATA